MESLSFYFSVYKDEVFAVRLAKQLNDWLKDSQAIVITDGEPYWPSLGYARSLNPNLIVIEGERLKNKSSGGCEFTQRNFEIVLDKTNTETIIKLDPDSYIWRSPKNIPDAGWFGDVHGGSTPFMGHKFNIIGGGAMGFKRDTIEKIVKSQFLLDKRYDKINAFYDRYSKFKKVADPVGEPAYIRSEDWTLADVCRRLGILPTQWDDVCCVQSEEQIQDELNYSITHPVRHIW